MKDAMSSHPSKTWIFKPDKTSGEGFGISLHQDLFDMPLDVPAMVQEYVTEPFLLDGKKVDMRLYPMVLAPNPLRVYLSRGGAAGYARTAGMVFSNDTSSLAAHITNVQAPEGTEKIRLTMPELFDVVKSKGLDPEKMQQRLHDLLGDLLPTLLDKLSCWDPKHKFRCGAAHAILGVDIVLDKLAFPFVVEVNPDPSLRFRSEGIWCYDAERTMQELSLTGLLPSSSYHDAIISASIFELTRRFPRSINEHLLRMVYEYVYREGAEMIYPRDAHSGHNSPSLDDLTRSTYEKFFSVKGFIDELMMQ